MKSNTVSFWRIILTFAIVLLHIGYGRGSYIAVEFFFVLSGFLLAKKVYSPSGSLGVLRYIWNRFVRLYPIYVISIITYIMILEYQATPTEFFMNGLRDIPGFWKQLLMLTPFGNPPAFFVNIPAWYVCVLFYVSIALFILLKYVPKKVILPFLTVVAIIILGYYFYTVGNLDLFEGYQEISIRDSKIVLGSDGVFRGIAEMSLGVVLYNIYDKTQDKIKPSNIVVCHIVEFGLFISVIVASIFIYHTRLDYIYLLVILICVYFAFLPYDNRIFNNRFINYLGGLSYSIYLNHAIFAWVVFSGYANQWTFTRVMIYIFCVIITAAIVDLPVRLINMALKRGRKNEKVL